MRSPLSGNGVKIMRKMIHLAAILALASAYSGALAADAGNHPNETQATAKKATGANDAASAKSKASRCDDSNACAPTARAWDPEATRPDPEP